VQTIITHHKENGWDDYFVRSMVGGDPPGGFPCEDIWVEVDGHYEDKRNVLDNANILMEYEENLVQCYVSLFILVIQISL
jgi:hypothetical protein